MATCHANRNSYQHFLYIVIPVVSIGVLTDQASKSWASLQAGELRILVPGYLAAYSVSNAGSVLGLSGDQARTATISALLGIACTILLLRLAYTDRKRWRGTDGLAGALLMAGILGNTVDRLALGHVRDFLVTWAIPTLVFNVADLLVVIGGASLFMARFRDRMHPRSELGSASRAAA